MAWEHFWVWLPLAALYLAFSGRRPARMVGWPLLAACLFLSPIWPPPTNPTGVWALLGCLPALGGLLLAVAGLPRGEFAERPDQPDEDRSAQGPDNGRRRTFLVASGMDSALVQD